MRRRGFTLIELTVVLAVIVVAAGFVIVRVAGWSSKQALHGSARTVGNVVRTWRERARAEETTYHLVLAGRDYRVLNGREVLRRGRLGSGQSFEPDAERTVALTPRGALPPTRLVLRNTSGERVALLLGTLTNDVDYQEER